MRKHDEKDQSGLKSQKQNKEKSGATWETESWCADGA